MRRKEAKEQGHSLASHPRLDADRVGPHYEEPQFEQYSDDGEEYDEDDDESSGGAEYGSDGGAPAETQLQKKPARVHIETLNVKLRYGIWRVIVVGI